MRNDDVDPIEGLCQVEHVGDNLDAESRADRFIRSRVADSKYSECMKRGPGLIYRSSYPTRCILTRSFFQMVYSGYPDHGPKKSCQQYPHSDVVDPAQTHRPVYAHVVGSNMVALLLLTFQHGGLTCIDKQMT